MIKKRIKKIAKITFLIGVRQIWKLIANVYHLLNQPFLTIKKLAQERDKSQIFLISAMAVMPLIGYASARIIFDLHVYGFLKNSVGLIFGITISLELIVFFYLIYWTWKVLKRR